MHTADKSLIAGLVDNCAARLGTRRPSLRAPLALETRNPQVEISTLAFWAGKIIEGTAHEKAAARAELSKLIGRGRAMLRAADVLAKQAPEKREG